MSDRRTYTVSGMSCSHCVAAVSESVQAIPGAEAVTVELDTGLLAVSGPDIDDAEVRAAVEQAGYSLI
jgi:copper chaperone CopZ